MKFESLKGVIPTEIYEEFDTELLQRSVAQAIGCTLSLHGVTDTSAEGLARMKEQMGETEFNRLIEKDIAILRETKRKIVESQTDPKKIKEQEEYEKNYQKMVID